MTGIAGGGVAAAHAFRGVDARGPVLIRPVAEDVVEPGKRGRFPAAQGADRVDQPPGPVSPVGEG